LSSLNLVIQNGSKKSGAALKKKKKISASIFTLVSCKTATADAGREHTDFAISNVNNPFYHKAAFTSLSVSPICTKNTIMLCNSNYNWAVRDAQRLKRGLKGN